MAQRTRTNAEINSGSMADIAFLLLIFFLITTTIATDKGILLILPPKPEIDTPPPVFQENERNIFNIRTNSVDNLLVENEPFGNIDDVHLLRPMIKTFVLNYGQDPTLSDSPEKAIVSFKTDRGTSYALFIAVLDELQAAYNEIYGERIANELLRLHPDKGPADLADLFRTLNLNDPVQRALYDKARNGIPRNISIAEPSKASN